MESPAFSRSFSLSSWKTAAALLGPALHGIGDGPSLGDGMMVKAALGVQAGGLTSGRVF